MFFSSFKTGELAGSTSAAQCPNIPCQRLTIKALGANSGKLYIGATSGVTKKDGSTDITTGFELAAGESVTVYPQGQNMNTVYYISDNSGDGFTYLAEL